MLPSGGVVYACLFVKTGTEAEVCKDVMRTFPNLRALFARQTKHHSHAGKASLVEVPLFHGYCFLQVPQDMELPRRWPHSCILTLLTNAEGDWQLFGRDEHLAQWLFERDGLIELSKAYQVGDRVVITSGPLKDFEAEIIRVDKRNRNGQVAIRFRDRVVKVWLGFELLDT